MTRGKLCDPDRSWAVRGIELTKEAGMVAKVSINVCRHEVNGAISAACDEEVSQPIDATLGASNCWGTELDTVCPERLQILLPS